jgi:hypothetical protein
MTAPEVDMGTKDLFLEKKKELDILKQIDINRNKSLPVSTW